MKKMILFLKIFIYKTLKQKIFILKKCYISLIATNIQNIKTKSNLILIFIAQVKKF